MQFERLANNHRVACFEPIDEVKWHEQFVAANALGSLTAKHRGDADARTDSGYLGMRIQCLENTKKVDDEKQTEGLNVHSTLGEQTPITSTMRLPASKAKLLMDALVEYVEDTPLAIRNSYNLNPQSCNLRAVEAAVASTMIDQIAEEYSLSAPAAKTTTAAGFK